MQQVELSSPLTVAAHTTSCLGMLSPARAGAQQQQQDPRLQLAQTRVLAAGVLAGRRQLLQLRSTAVCLSWDPAAGQDQLLLLLLQESPLLCQHRVAVLLVGPRAEARARWTCLLVSDAWIHCIVRLDIISNEISLLIITNVISLATRCVLGRVGCHGALVLSRLQRLHCVTGQLAQNEHLRVVCKQVQSCRTCTGCMLFFGLPGGADTFTCHTVTLQVKVRGSLSCVPAQLSNPSHVLAAVTVKFTFPPKCHSTEFVNFSHYCAPTTGLLEDVLAEIQAETAAAGRGAGAMHV